MAVNQYFGMSQVHVESDLVNDLVVETIQMRGMDLHYIIRDTIDDDYLLGEAPLSSFTKAVVIEMYMSNVTNFNGDGDLFSKFGLDMQDTFTIEVAITRFKEEMVKLGHTTITMPREGDLLYLPIGDSLLEITKVKFDQEYKQWGKNYKYVLECALFEYSHEEFNTGVPDIDEIGGLSIDVLLSDGDTVVESPEPDDTGDNDLLASSYNSIIVKK